MKTSWTRALGLKDFCRSDFSRAISTVLVVMGFLAACSTDAIDREYAESKLNVLFILADDLGFADVSMLGSEIQTPNIDSIAENGTLFTRFYASPICSPTRSMLLTGVDNHKNGLGNMAEVLADNQIGQPGYEGYLNEHVATLPALLQEANYHTYMAGKWHLGFMHDQSPRARGFERSFVLLNGSAGHFDDMAGVKIDRQTASYREDGELLDSLPKGFYSSRSYTDKLIAYIDSNLEDGRPFFAYAAYTAPHWPVQAPDDVIDKYAGVYDEGYDAVRAARYQRIKELGLIPQDATYPVRPDFVPGWDSLSTEQKSVAAREMEVYAAMVDDLDANIGRLLTYLEEAGELENTLVVFLSDNGSDSFSLEKAPPPIADFAKTLDNSVGNIGRRNSFSLIGPKWANVGEAPFRLYKAMTSEGGIRVAAAIQYPKSSRANNINTSIVSVMDLVPTVLELVGIDHPEQFNGKDVSSLDGKSIVPILAGDANQVRGEDDTIGIEIVGRRAMIKGDWKIVHLPEPAGKNAWELFNVKTDPGEQHDLAAIEPEKLKELMLAWDSYQDEVGIIVRAPGPFKIRPTPSPDH